MGVCLSLLNVQEFRSKPCNVLSLHLGLLPKVNNVQGAIWLCRGREGRRGEWWKAAVGGGKGCNEHKHMEKQIFALPAAVGQGKCQHAPRPRLTVLHSAPPPGPFLLSHRVWAAVTLWRLSLGYWKPSRCSGSLTCMYSTPTLLAHRAIFHTKVRLGNINNKFMYGFVCIYYLRQLKMFKNIFLFRIMPDTVKLRIRQIFRPVGIAVVWLVKGSSLQADQAVKRKKNAGKHQMTS